MRDIVILPDGLGHPALPLSPRENYSPQLGWGLKEKLSAEGMIIQTRTRLFQNLPPRSCGFWGVEYEM